MYKKIGLVPQRSPRLTPCTVKSKGISTINTFNVECHLVAKRLVLKDDGKAELYSVQSLFLHQVGRARGSNKPLGASSFLDSAYMLTLFRLEVFSFPKIQRLFRFSSYFHGLLEKVAKASL